MERKLICPDFNKIPEEFHRLMYGAAIYDSSCSSEAQVFYIDKDKGYFLKSAPAGTLKKEAELTAWFHKKRLATEVLAYISNEKDWMLTEKVPGEDLTWTFYRENPERVCDVTAELLRKLHETDFSDCPVPDRTAEYLDTARYNYEHQIYNASLFPDNWGYKSPQEAWTVVEKYGHLLKRDILLHGDYCLPNIILNNWKFSGFIDLGCSGVGDRHVDIFWGIWTLYFNFKTDRYRERFLDAYGKYDIEPDLLKVIAAIEVFG